jgi:hypothetical protein
MYPISIWSEWPRNTVSELRLDAVDRGLTTTVVSDAVAGVDLRKGDAQQALETMRQAGVRSRPPDCSLRPWIERVFGETGVVFPRRSGPAIDAANGYPGCGQPFFLDRDGGFPQYSPKDQYEKRGGVARDSR